eukprot:scaffold1606_cov177-Pinguiococcus_pyrenoidosus.AAC.5
MGHVPEQAEEDTEEGHRGVNQRLWCSKGFKVLVVGARGAKDRSEVDGDLILVFIPAVTARLVGIGRRPEIASAHHRTEGSLWRGRCKLGGTLFQRFEIVRLRIEGGAGESGIAPASSCFCAKGSEGCLGHLKSKATAFFGKQGTRVLAQGLRQFEGSLEICREVARDFAHASTSHLLQGDGERVDAGDEVARLTIEEILKAIHTEADEERVAEVQLGTELLRAACGGIHFDAIVLRGHEVDQRKYIDDALRNQNFGFLADEERRGAHPLEFL